jgi:Protein of unknown function (DUF3376)
LRGWATRRGLFQHDQPTTDDQLRFVHDFDLDYAMRRLQFVLAGVSWVYRDLGKPGVPTREQLDKVKERLSVANAQLEWVVSGKGFAEQALGGVRTCFGEERLNAYLGAHGFDTDQFLDDHGSEFDDLNAALRTFLDDQLKTFAPDLYRDLLTLTDDWPEGETRGKIRRDLLNRYLGFPIWDALLYPLQAYTGVNERDAVRVTRMSPIDAKLLRPTGGQKVKVLGAQLGHAYAFFSRPARENDYLWGRLDAAEAMIRLLLTTRTADGRVVAGDKHKDYVASCKAVFHAVLDEEAKHLPTINDVVVDLRKQVDVLT